MTLNRVIHDKNNPYLTINTSIVFDKTISGKAKALWLYAFSRPADWQFYSCEMEKHFMEGRDSIRNGLNELEKAGYLKREQDRLPNGKMGALTWFWYEVSQIILPQPENAGPVDAGPAKPQLLSNEYKQSNKENNNPTPSEAPAAVVVPSCLEKLGIKKSLQIKLTKKYGKDPKRISDACEAVNAMHPDSLEATIQSALKGSWTANDRLEDVLGGNTQYLCSLRCKDGASLGRYKLEVGPTYIHFRHTRIDGSRDVHYTTDQKGFKGAVKAFIQKNRY